MADTQTLGHVHSSSLMLRLASHHLAVFSQLIGQMMTPLACRVAPAPVAAPARFSHTFRGMFVAVDGKRGTTHIDLLFYTEQRSV
jgi:hypothetical protein